MLTSKGLKMNQKFYDLAKKIADWHTVTFKDADKAGQLLKLDEEFDDKTLRLSI